MESYGYKFKNEEERKVIDEIFANLEVVELNKQIAEQVIIYRSTGKRKIKLPDAIILATARHLNADLLSDDWDDFTGLDEEVRIIRLKDYMK